ncbi:hypothetical protein LCGC14_1606190 [marine sediment metagenome]|uniref:Uncharacterized protein n=1 Tax=marine sediment metagenome TaxID=412755 RepID=A0A0F9IA12_9ZZZZ
MKHMKGELKIRDNELFVETESGRMEIARFHGVPELGTTSVGLANARRLRKCWNEYDGLVDALKEARDMLTLNILIDKSNQTKKSLYIVEQALQRAESE